MTPIKKNSRIADLKKTLTAGTLAIMVAGTMVFTGCSSSQSYTEEEKIVLTEGLVTTVKEQEPDVFKITDESKVDSVADSRIIAEYIDGKRDTFTLDEARLISADTNNPQRAGMSNAFMYGVMGYYMGRSMGGGINRNAYASQSAYQKSTTRSSAVQSTARRTTVRKPTNSSKGFGSGKSTRSFGG